MGANENSQQNQKRKIEETKKDKEAFKKFERIMRWNVWKKPILKTARGATPGPTTTRIIEVLDDNVKE